MIETRLFGRCCWSVGVRVGKQCGEAGIALERGRQRHRHPYRCLFARRSVSKDSGLKDGLGAAFTVPDALMVGFGFTLAFKPKN